MKFMHLFIHSTTRTTRFSQYWVKKATYAAAVLQLRVISFVQVQFYSPCWQLLPDLGDFSNGICQVVKMSITEKSPDLGIDTTNILVKSGVLAKDSSIRDR